MNEARKLKAYSFIEGIESRAKLLEKGNYWCTEGRP